MQLRNYIIHPDDLRRAGNIEKAIRSADPDVRITQIASWGEMLGMTVCGRSFATFCVALAGGIASWRAGKAVAHYVYNGEKYQNLKGLAIATVIMLVIIAAASLMPALRALRVEPGSILNKE